MNQRLAQVAARNWYVALLVTLVAVAVAGAITLLTPSVYRATAGVYVGTGDASDASDLSQGAQYTQQQVKNYADIATREIVLAPTIRQLGLDVSTSQLAQQVTASAPLGTSIVEITAEAGSPAQAARIANVVTQNLVDVADDLTPRSLVSVTRVQSASPPLRATSPSTTVNLALGLLLGLILSGVLIYLRERLDNRVRTSVDLARVTDRPVLGEILYDKRAVKQPLIVRSEPDGVRAEAFRALRTNLQFLRFGKHGRTFVITSSVAAEGKTTTCANLAIALADAGERVLVIDADLRRPSLSSYFGLSGELGLSDVLIGAVSLEHSVQRWSDREVTVLPAGSIPPNPSELLQSHSMQDLLASVREQYSVVLIDSAPLLAISDAAVLAKRTSGAVVVCAAGRTKRGELANALEALRRVHAKTLGVVMTMTKQTTANAYVYGMDARRIHRSPDTSGRPEKESLA